MESPKEIEKKEAAVIIIDDSNSNETSNTAEQVKNDSKGEVKQMNKENKLMIDVSSVITESRIIIIRLSVCQSIRKCKMDSTFLLVMMESNSRSQHS